MLLFFPQMSLFHRFLEVYVHIHILVTSALESLIVNEEMGAGFKPSLKVVPPSTSNTLPWHFVYASSEERVSLIETSMPLFAMLLFLSELSGWESWSSKAH